MSIPKQKPGKSKQDYATPWEFIEAVEARWGKIDIDLAARVDNSKAPVFIRPEQNSLTSSWHGIHRAGEDPHEGPLCWLNPEFADIRPWAAKCHLETHYYKISPRIILLTPASIGSNWFSEYVHKKASVYALSPRITFVGETHPFPKDCMISLFGFRQKPSFDVWRWKP